jgi:hypothetical protein
MNKQKSNHMPHSIEEFGIDHQIWTDRDLIKFTVMAFIAGIIIGILV